MLSLYLSMLETDEERESFSEFYGRHKGRCFMVALAITRNHAWAEEAVHEAFLRMIRHKEKYFSNPCKRTGTQIVIMVKSAALDTLKRENRLDHEPLDSADYAKANNAPDIFRMVVSKIAADRLKYHVSQLDEVSRQRPLSCLL